MAPCPKLNPAFSHSIQKTEALLELLGQSSFLAPVLAAICPDQGIFFMAEECVAQQVSALPSLSVCCLSFIQLKSSNAINEGHQASLIISYSQTKMSKCCTLCRSVEGAAGRRGRRPQNKRAFTCIAQRWSHGTDVSLTYTKPEIC